MKIDENIEEIKSFLQKKAESILKSLILDPDFEFHIKDIKIIEKKTKSFDNTYKVLVVETYTNNRALLLGQFVYFPIGGLRGFHNNWIEASLLTSLMDRFDIKDKCFVHIEAIPDKKQKNYTYRYLPLEKAIKEKIINKNSPFVSKMKKYKLKKILLAGSIISGPDYGTMSEIEKICKGNKVKSLLDLFCGSGALSKTALMNGVEKATCVDTYIKSAYENLRELGNRVNFIEGDAFDYKINDKFDLIISDAFIDYGYDVVKRIVPRCIHNTDLFFMTLGFIEDIYWVETLKRELEKYFSVVDTINSGRLIHAICR